MPLFKDNDTLLILHRNYEFNSEALDGKIKKIDDTDKCIALHHAPNSTWNYNVTPLSLNYSDSIWETYGNKAEPTQPPTPTDFIGIVLQKDLDEYIKLHNYILTQLPEISNVKKENKENKVYININPPKRSPSKKVNFQDPLEFSYKLVRDAETTVHTFKQPNLK